jgi:protease-4
MRPAPRFCSGGAEVRGLALALFGVALATSGCITINLPGAPGGGLEETVVDGKAGPKILMLDLSGPLSTKPEETRFGLGRRESPTARLREEIDHALEDEEIAALLLRIDSPGGTVIASDILYREVRRFKEKTGRPVIAQLMGSGTSGAYYVAMAADEVRAYPTTVTGSIGVIIVGINVAGLMERFGVENQTITTGPFKDAGSPLRPMREEERAQLASVARDLFDSFLDAVEVGRPKLTRARIASLADGRIYSGPQALEAGLVDALGDLPQAVESARAAAGITGEARVVVYHRPGEEPASLFWAAIGAAGAAPVLDPAELAGPAFLYLWSPGGTLPELRAQ